jgi:hypothetical protein
LPNLTLSKNNEAPRSKLRGILSGVAPKLYPPSLSHKLRRGRLAIRPCSKLQSILAKANELGRGQLFPISASWLKKVLPIDRHSYRSIT